MSREMLLKLQGVQGSPVTLARKVGFIFYKPKIICCNCCHFESWTIVCSHLISASLLSALGKIARSTVAQLTGWVENSPEFLSPFLEVGYLVRGSYPMFPVLTLIPLPPVHTRRRGSSIPEWSPYMTGCGQTLAISVNLIFT